MDDFSESIIERETALANLDHARDDFEQAFAAVPDGALDWMPADEEYSFGTILAHMRRAIEMYSVILDLMREAEFEEVRLASIPGDYATVEEQPTTYEEDMAITLRHGARVKYDRQGAIDALDAAHDRLAGKLRALATEEYTRATPVVYAGTTEPFPTRASDILKWITDHYNEHVVQFGAMLKQWQKEKGA
jgi:hypothetical protein